jgi:hypothetical protein
MNTNEAPRKMGITAAEAERDDPGVLKIIVNGEKETIEEKVVVELNDEGQKVADGPMFSFYNSAKIPIILRMHNGFDIVLKEIKTK